jgi:ATP-dependent protease ClpP protease subunit
VIAVLAEATGSTHEQLATDIDRDKILRGQAAVDYGLVDHVIARRHAPALAA